MLPVHATRLPPNDSADIGGPSATVVLSSRRDLLHKLGLRPYGECINLAIHVFEHPDGSRLSATARANRAEHLHVSIPGLTLGGRDPGCRGATTAVPETQTRRKPHIYPWSFHTAIASNGPRTQAHTKSSSKMCRPLRPDETNVPKDVETSANDAYRKQRHLMSSYQRHALCLANSRSPTEPLKNPLSRPASGSRSSSNSWTTSPQIEEIRCLFQFVFRHRALHICQLCCWTRPRCVGRSWGFGSTTMSEQEDWRIMARSYGLQ
ncbi:hypothetical protein J3F83DRAFT_47926 [Trichoderma novae-zelandiae]